MKNFLKGERGFFVPFPVAIILLGFGTAVAAGAVKVDKNLIVTTDPAKLKQGEAVYNVNK